MQVIPSRAPQFSGERRRSDHPGWGKEGLHVSRTTSVAMGTSASKPSPTTSSFKRSESEANDTDGGAWTTPPHPGRQSRPLTKPIARSNGKAKSEKRNNKDNSTVATETRRVKRLAKPDTAGAPPPSTSVAASPAVTPAPAATGPPAAASAVAVAPAAARTAVAATAAAGRANPADKWTYEAMAPFLRSEGWKCADGRGFHTWFFVTEAADGKKSVDYLVSEKAVVAFVRRDRSVLARYEAYRRSHAVAAGAGRSKQHGGGVKGPAGRAAAGARSLSESAGGGRRGGRGRGSSSPAVSTGAGRLSKDAAIARGGSRASVKTNRRVEEETPSVGVARTSTRSSSCSLKGASIVVGGTSTRSSHPVKEAAVAVEEAATSTACSATETPTVSATRTSARAGRSAKYNLLVKPAAASTESERLTKAGPNAKAAPSSSGVGGGQTLDAGIPAVKGQVGRKAESESPIKAKPARRAARPSTAALGGPVEHSAVVRAAAEAAERAVGLRFPAVKPRAERAPPQEPSATKADSAGHKTAKAPVTPALSPPAVDWAGRAKSKTPGGTATPSPPAAKYIRVELGARSAAASPRRSASVPAPPTPLRGGWARVARPHQAGGGYPQQYAGSLGSRKRSRETTANWAQSWRQKWPTLREEGWHWEYGNDLAASCVYLKPGVSREGATLGVNMFDSKQAVLQHVQDSASGAAAAGEATGDSATGPPADDGSRCYESTKKPSVDEHARATRKQPCFGGGKSKPRPCASSRGSDDQEKEREGRSRERSVSIAKDSPAPSRADPGPIGCAPGPPPQGPLVGARNKQLHETIGSEGSPADNEDDVELAASVVMEMLRVETTTAGETAAEPAAKRRVGFGSSDARGEKLDTATTDPPAAAPWGVDKLTAHCCEQLVALSELGGAGGVVGKRGGSSGDDSRAEAGSSSGGRTVDGLDRILKRTASRHPGSPPKDAEQRDGRGPTKRSKEGLSPAVEKKGVAGSPSTTFVGLPGPLAGVGVVVAVAQGGPRKDIEAEVVRLGGEVVEVFSKDGLSDGWRACLLGEAGPVAEGGSAASKNGKRGGCFDGPSASKIMSVAAPGSDRTPEFLLAVAAGKPIVHPSYLNACSRTGSKVDTAGYLMPYGRSALGSRGLIMPSGSTRERPFQGKTIILCLNDLAAATDGIAVENWALIFGVAGATVKLLLEGDSDSGSGGGGGGGAVATTTNGHGAGYRCSAEGALQLLAEGRVHCVICSSTDGSPRASSLSSSAAAMLQAAEDAGTPTGTLEWAAQCLAHGRFLLPTADTCPWFPVGVVAAGTSSDRTSSTAPGGGGSGCGNGGGGGNGGGRGTSAPKAEVGRSARVSGGGVVGAFHVHASGARRYVAGDYVLLQKQHDVSSQGSARTVEGVGEAAAEAEAGGTTGSLPPVARVESFLREADDVAVKVAVEVMDRGGDPKILAAAGGAGEQQEVDEGMLGGRVLVLTRREAEATRLYASKDGGIFYLGD